MSLQPGEAASATEDGNGLWLLESHLHVKNGMYGAYATRRNLEVSLVIWMVWKRMITRQTRVELLNTNLSSYLKDRRVWKGFPYIYRKLFHDQRVNILIWSGGCQIDAYLNAYYRYRPSNIEILMILPDVKVPKGQICRIAFKPNIQAGEGLCYPSSKPKITVRTSR